MRSGNREEQRDRGNDNRGTSTDAHDNRSKKGTGATTGAATE